MSGPLIVSAVVYASHHAIARSSTFLSTGWLVEAPKLLHPDGALTVLDALLLSRRSLINQATLCSTILLVHVCSSWFTEDRHRRKVKVPEGEVNSVPRREGRRAYLYVLFTVSVTLWVLCVRIALKEAKLGIWQSESRTDCPLWLSREYLLFRIIIDLSYPEVVVISLFYQFALYAAIRLAHHGFTLGELGLVCFGATVLFMEMVNLTKAKVRVIPQNFFGINPLIYFAALACYNTIYQDLPSTHPPLNISDCSYTRNSSHWGSAFSLAVSLTTYRPTSRSSITLPRRETQAPSFPRPRLLCGNHPHRWWTDWVLDTLVSRQP